MEENEQQYDVVRDPIFLVNIKQLSNTNAAIISAENLLKNLKEEKERLEKLISEMMIENDMPAISIGGYMVRLSTDYLVSVPEANVKAFHEWLLAHGIDIYNASVVVPCDDTNSAELISDNIKSVTGHNADIKLSVHWKKLSSNLKELVEEQGVTPPEDLAKLFIRRSVRLAVSI